MGRPGVWLKFAYAPGVARDRGAAPRRAAANGAFPDSDAVLLPADRPQQIILSTNFGLIISDDGGATLAVDLRAPRDVDGVDLRDGRAPQESLYSLSPDVGLASSDDVSCSWHRDGRRARERRSRPTSFPIRPTRRTSSRSRPRARGRRRRRRRGLRIDRRRRDASTPTPIYVAPAGDQLVGVEIARSDPRIIYVAIAAPGPHPALARSDDAGATGRRSTSQPSIGARTARIIAVDPVDANVVYLRAIGAGSELLAISRDGGMTFTTPITLAGGSLSAFARLASGTVLVAGLLPGDGGTTAGVAWRSGDGGVTFDDWTLAPMPRLRALAERDGTLYLAGSNYSDGWALAVSTDEGRTIQPIARYDQVSAVRPCVAAVCQDLCDEQAGRTDLGRPRCATHRRSTAAAPTRATAAAMPGRPQDVVGMRLQQRRGAGRGAGVAIALLFFVTARRSAARRRRRGTRCSSAR